MDFLATAYYFSFGVASLVTMCSIVQSCFLIYQKMTFSFTTRLLFKVCFNLFYDIKYTYVNIYVFFKKVKTIHKLFPIYFNNYLK